MTAVALHRLPAFWIALIIALASGGRGTCEAQTASVVAPVIPEPFASFHPPDAWVERFWADPSTKTLFASNAKTLAAMVPAQAGFRFCRCPSCPAEESEDPLVWSPATPEKLTCRRCGAVFPNEKFPAKAEKDKKLTEEVVEVRAGLLKKYPYHAPDPEFVKHEDERVYLAAKRDYEAREYLAKAALYAAIRHRDDRTGKPDPTWSRLACVLILRFAQVYPIYATHYDQPGEPKYLQPAELRPPYRRGYRTGKWDWLGSLDVPLNLVIAYAIVRDTPAMAEAGKALDDPQPARTIERDLFAASAAFVLKQPEEFTEASLTAYRGVLAVARVLNDADLMREIKLRIDEFSRRGFYHDGFWRQGEIRAHRRVLGQLDGWLDPLTVSSDRKPGTEPGTFAMLPLVRSAGAAFLGGTAHPDVLQVAWTPVTPRLEARRPLLLGGAGVARLAVGSGADALDLELRGQDGFGGAHFQRQSIRLAVGGVPVLDDLDEYAMLAGGWNLATASHNTVLIDGLNQRETFEKARERAAGGSFVYFAVEPSFQVATLDDPRAYPISAKQYRQTVVLCEGPRSRYAVSVFAVEGGLQHDQIFHARPGSQARWRTATLQTRLNGSLLPPSIPYIRNTRVEDGRWFVQSYGEFRELTQGVSTRAETATLADPKGAGVRLHLLGDTPRTLISALTPEPDADPVRGGRASLIVRRRSEDGETLRSTFVTLFEPRGSIPALRSVGRVKTEDGCVLLQVETVDGVEYLLFNSTPGTVRSVHLPDGRVLETDGLVVRIRGDELVLAGGNQATFAGRKVERKRVTGRVVGVSRAVAGESRGWFELRERILDDEPLAGRTLLIRHGDGISHGWTIDRVENTPEGLSRIHVREEPGFLIDSDTGTAQFYQFPATRHPAPHDFAIPGLAR